MDTITGQGYKLNFSEEYSDELKAEIVECVDHVMNEARSLVNSPEELTRYISGIERQLNKVLSKIQNHEISVVYQYKDMGELDPLLVFKVVGKPYPVTKPDLEPQLIVVEADWLEDALDCDLCPCIAECTIKSNGRSCVQELIRLGIARVLTP